MRSAIASAAGLALFALPTMTLSLAAWDGDGPPPFHGGTGGPGPKQTRPVLKQFDKDGNGRLDADERKEARAFLARQPAPRKGFGGRGHGPGGVGDARPPTPGPAMTPANVTPAGGSGLYDPKVLRTLFFDFAETDWEKELEEFHGTDADVAAKLTVDGKAYPDVGVRFRGMSSYMMVPAGMKRSLNVSIDFAGRKQRLMGSRTLNLLNSHEDPGFLRAVLFCDIAREYLPAPRANLVRVAVNGEYWGVYVNMEQINGDFTRKWFGGGKCARWKVPGSPNGRGSLAYLGDKPEAYRDIYAIKSADCAEPWLALIGLCKTLNETPPEKLRAALEPVLDVEGALRFLALENVFANGDGYWTRSSDYAICRDPAGRFHILPCDVNETFSFGRGPGGPRRPPGGPGPGPGPGGMSPPGGVKLDPLAQANNPDRPLISKLLAVPELKARYLELVKEISTRWLDWDRLGPIARSYHDLIDSAVKADTRKLDSYKEFEESLDGPNGIKAFVEQRRAYLDSRP